MTNLPAIVISWALCDACIVWSITAINALGICFATGIDTFLAMLTSPLASYIIIGTGILAPGPLSFASISTGSTRFCQSDRFLITRHQDWFAKVGLGANIV